MRIKASLGTQWFHELKKRLWTGGYAGDQSGFQGLNGFFAGKRCAEAGSENGRNGCGAAHIGTQHDTTLAPSADDASPDGVMLQELNLRLKCGGVRIVAKDH